MNMEMYLYSRSLELWIREGEGTGRWLPLTPGLLDTLNIHRQQQALERGGASLFSCTHVHASGLHHFWGAGVLTQGPVNLAGGHMTSLFSLTSN